MKYLLILSITLIINSNSYSASLENNSCRFNLIILDSIPKVQMKNNQDSSEDEATYPGGTAAWNKYIQNSMKEYIDELSKRTRVGSYTANIKFIVEVDGSIGEVEVADSNNKNLGKIGALIIKESKRWHPAMQHGKPVKAYRIQPFTFKVVDEKNYKG